MIPNVLTIAGSDPGGGAGVQADLKTFAALRCHGLSAITALTVQNTRGVFDIHTVPAAFVAAEIAALFDDSRIAAVKIGMLASGEIARAVGEVLARRQPAFVVLDPVRAASTGARLASEELAAAILTHLAPLVDLVTPNLAEAAWLCGAPLPAGLDDMEGLARELHRRGFRAVLVKGGHRDAATCDDLFFDGSAVKIFSGARVMTRNTHGTGCTLASAIAAYVAQGLPLDQAIERSKRFVAEALAAADALDAGAGAGPLNHFHAWW